MTTLPTWAFWLTAVGAPLVGVFGVLYGHAVTRRGLEQVDHWRRREETMRMMRWSAENIGKSDERMSRIGFASLIALTQSELLQAEDVTFLDAVAQAAVDTVPEDVVSDVPEYAEDGGEPMTPTPPPPTEGA